MLCDPAALGRGGPKDLEEQATRFLNDSVELVADKDVVGKCGEHSKRSSWASGLYDQYVSVVDAKSGGIRQEHLWLCGHFVAKPFSVFLQRAAEAPGGAGALPTPKHLNVLLWQTKSGIVPSESTASEVVPPPSSDGGPVEAYLGDSVTDSVRMLE